MRRGGPSMTKKKEERSECIPKDDPLAKAAELAQILCRLGPYERAENIRKRLRKKQREQK